MTKPMIELTLRVVNSVGEVASEGMGRLRQSHDAGRWKRAGIGALRAHRSCPSFRLRRSIQPIYFP